MTGEDDRWTILLRKTLDADPAWTDHVRALSPRTSLRVSLAEFVHAMSHKLAPTTEEIEAAERVMAAMKRGGYSTPDDFLDAVERREVTPDGRRSKTARSGRGKRR